MPFSEIAGRLIANDVENYHADIATDSFTFYGASCWDSKRRNSSGSGSGRRDRKRRRSRSTDWHPVRNYGNVNLRPQRRTMLTMQQAVASRYSLPQNPVAAGTGGYRGAHLQQVKRIQFSIEIAAPVSRVFRIMLDPEGYKDWASPFFEGSYYEGTWQQGQKIRFLSPSGDGMVSEIAEHRPDEFTSIRHLGYIIHGVEDTQSESVRAWAPVFENYTFSTIPTGTRLVVDQDVTADFEECLVQAWPKALQRLKALCETGAAATEGSSDAQRRLK